MACMLPIQPTEMVIRKLERRQSYMAKAPYQRKSRKQALGDAAMRLSPATWFGPVILRAHERYEYRRARKHTEDLYTEYQEKKSTRQNSAASSTTGSDIAPAPFDWSPLWSSDEEDPWKLPPVEEIY
ncbi:MAG: hypothetical protein Q9191_005545 [Dirinaria sp. TL-2023a]